MPAEFWPQGGPEPKCAQNRCFPPPYSCVKTAWFWKKNLGGKGGLGPLDPLVLLLVSEPKLQGCLSATKPRCQGGKEWEKWRQRQWDPLLDRQFWERRIEKATHIFEQCSVPSLRRSCVRSEKCDPTQISFPVVCRLEIFLISLQSSKDDNKQREQMKKLTHMLLGIGKSFLDLELMSDHTYLIEFRPESMTNLKQLWWNMHEHFQRKMKLLRKKVYLFFFQVSCSWCVSLPGL